MIRACRIVVCVFILSFAASAAVKSHIVAFGKWSTIFCRVEDNGGKPVSLKIRPLLVDGHTSEMTTGNAHDVTERTFVVQSIYRVNDSLPQESGAPQWQWQRGGWLLVDRVRGMVHQIVLPRFDPDHSVVSWYRDYAAYFGASEDGNKVLAIVVQLGRRRPLLAKPILEATESTEPLPTPKWTRNPVRAIFELKPDQKLIFAVIGHTAEVQIEDDEEEGSN